MSVHGQWPCRRLCLFTNTLVSKLEGKHHGEDVNLKVLSRKCIKDEAEDIFTACI